MQLMELTPKTVTNPRREAPSSAPRTAAGLSTGPCERGRFLDHDRPRSRPYGTPPAQNISAVINGGDGSQRISQGLFELSCPVIGVPKTIDNDLSDTDFTFGFQTAVDAATDAVDKLVTTAASHHRVLILEVMGRYAGWIAMHAAIAGGAEVCLIPEIDYDINSVMNALNRRFAGKGFANIVIAEGAKPLAGTMSYTASEEPGAMPIRLGGAGLRPPGNSRM